MVELGSGEWGVGNGEWGVGNGEWGVDYFMDVIPKAPIIWDGALRYATTHPTKK
ncbi:hypothetical protein NIES3585_31330 [Nodularia sp. NIES-3585]|nr:hypothetical protein NIES3585_31330 [Nodularia sp. NIES-3585]